MKIYMQEHYVVFDFEDGKTCKYHLQTKECIGKRGKPVKNLRSQLKDIDVLDAIQYAADDDFKKVMKYFGRTWMKYQWIIYVLDTGVTFKYIDVPMLLGCEVEGLNNWL